MKRISKYIKTCGDCPYRQHNFDADCMECTLNHELMVFDEYRNSIPGWCELPDLDDNPMKPVENACTKFIKIKKAYHNLFFETLEKQAIEHNLPPENLIKIYLAVLLEKVHTTKENINANEILKIAIKKAKALNEI